MNILIITNISNNPASGLCNIVPYYIKYISKEDNIFWYNLNDNYIVSNDLKHLYHSKKEYGLNIRKIPFSKIDLVHFHGVYFYDYYIIAKQLIKANIPYVISPHGSLTRDSLNLKRFKKKVGIKIFVKKFVVNAKAIHYLSVGEQRASELGWNNNSFVINNGVEPSKHRKKCFNSNKLRGIYIGRLAIYHKGIDLLIDACSQLKEKLEVNNVKIDMFGPEENGSSSIILDSINEKGLQNVLSLHDGIFGKEKIQELLKSDFFILTSRSEGHPCAVLEAMSIGIPCLVTAGTNIADEINSNNAGWVAENCSSRIKDALVQLIEERNQLNLKGINANMLSQKYSWDHIGCTLSIKYRELVEK